jgi:pyruvate kinase
MRSGPTATSAWAKRARGRMLRRVDTELASLLTEVEALRDRVAASTDTPTARAALAAVHPERLAGATNLVHYVALRATDLRPLQARLLARGLAPLVYAGSAVLPTLDTLLTALGALAGRPSRPAPPLFVDTDPVAAHADALFGPPPEGRRCRIMVTAPAEAADDPALLRALSEAGLDCLRVNCARDAAPAWQATIEHLRAAARESGRPCRVLMDLTGPKLRTAEIVGAPAVLRLRPNRETRAPARLWVTDAEVPAPAPESVQAVLRLPAAWRAHLQPGEKLRVTDARGRARTLRVAEVLRGGAVLTARRRVHLAAGVLLRHARRAVPEGAAEGTRDTTLGPLPLAPCGLSLSAGDALEIARDERTGRPATPDACAVVGCTLPEALAAVRVGDPVSLDDGKFRGRVEAVAPDHVRIRLEHVRGGTQKLRAGRGINLPETPSTVPALTERDHADLPFVAAHADMVALSFVNAPEDVFALQARLDAAEGPSPVVTLKIETRRAVADFPALLLAALRKPVCGVLIARGDLAVECGFERLAEIQEELLRLCEAAHVPVVWATQVLETLAQAGVATRAEIADVALGRRADCIMLNKGPHIVEAVRLLDALLRRLERREPGRRPALPPLT